MLIANNTTCAQNHDSYNHTPIYSNIGKQQQLCLPQVNGCRLPFAFEPSTYRCEKALPSGSYVVEADELYLLEESQFLLHAVPVTCLLHRRVTESYSRCITMMNSRLPSSFNFRQNKKYQAVVRLLSAGKPWGGEGGLVSSTGVASLTAGKCITTYCV